ncbi:S8 family serine peptidase [Agreia sp. VKM Ac-1783]|uniref:S8 family serine peptidase n=1 Tax=Agreia sp. VKM Ac-1783 TaxID=1938889 RepID=UPI000A2ACBD3|nr:S8 family serine peptidase [Agreia sp. VKM Ac-1783]SMQ68379.1 Subtilase family protein [Agreia sp. VKM Ac-1783]
MAGGPLQIVLDPERFRDTKMTPQGGGAGKDFFKGFDDAFVEHRDDIASALERILERHPDSDLINIVVQMRPDALAKSHRPFAKLFASRRASHVGTIRYGELVFATSSAKLGAIIDLIRSAEEAVAIKTDARGVERYSPTLQRSETSAIDSVREWRANTERGFTLDEAEEWVGVQADTKLEIDTFDVPENEPMRREALAQFGALDAVVSSHEAIDRTNLPKMLFTPRSSTTSVDGVAIRRLIQNRRDDLPDALPVAPDVRLAIGEVEQLAVVQRVRLQEKIPDPEVSPGVDPDNLGAPVELRTPDIAQGVVGVIDGGVFGPMASSVVEATDLLAEEHRSINGANHASQIASIIAMGSSFNSGLLPAAEDCRIYDLGIFPAANFTGVYYPSLEDFFAELREGCQRARDAFGVRIFNLSSILRRPPGATSYSIAARRLDEIALELDIIFVVSVGNLSRIDQRLEWPANPTDAIAMLAQGGAPDGVGSPSESLANLGIGAINPPGLAFEIEGAPTRYTRRGGRIPSALKPDLAAYGGAAPDSMRADTGLRAMDAFGNMNNVRGTSYSAPIVSRYLATLDQSTAGSLSREALIALTIHHAESPALLNSKPLKNIGQSFIGHGVPQTVEETLDGDTHRMTVLLNDRVLPGRGIEFPFTWPRSLADSEGSCHGLLRLTIVARPTLNYVHGDEMVRINLDAAVKQADENGRFARKTQPTHQFFSGFTYANERTLATELGKWYPIKSYEAAMPRGVGRSTDWTLEVDYLSRAGERPPEAGVEFAVIMTIEDPAGEAPVFDEMRASLSTIGVRLSDLRTRVNVSAAV